MRQGSRLHSLLNFRFGASLSIIHATRLISENEGKNPVSWTKFPYSSCLVITVNNIARENVVSRSSHVIVISLFNRNVARKVIAMFEKQVLR